MVFIHVDMDAFFSSIEQRDNKNLIGEPVIVSDDMNKRSVVCTCSYEARKYGIHSSMPSKLAYKLCPNGIFIKPRMSYYKEISDKIRDIFFEFSDKVEMFSLDEAYLEIKNEGINKGKKIAEMIKKRIFKEVELMSSAGISFNKFLAKIASDYGKPNGLMCIDKTNYEKIIDGLDVRKIFGIGETSAKKLYKIGIKTGNDLRKLSKEKMYKMFGKRGIILFDNIRGIDNSEIIVSRIKKSISCEKTLDVDSKIEFTLDILKKQTEKIFSRIVYENLCCKTVGVKIKFFDFKQITIEASMNDIIKNKEEMFDIVLKLLKYKKYCDKKVRLVGIKATNLFSKDMITEQLRLF